MNIDPEKLLAAHNRDREVLALESLLGEDVMCEYYHTEGVEPCGGVVVARAMSCTKGINVCEPGVQTIEARKMEQDCLYCRRPARECWRIERI